MSFKIDTDRSDAYRGLARCIRIVELVYSDQAGLLCCCCMQCNVLYRVERVVRGSIVCTGENVVVRVFSRLGNVGIDSPGSTFRDRLSALPGCFSC